MKVVQLGIVYRVAAGVPDLTIDAIASTLTVTADMSSLERGRHVGILAMDKTTRTNDVLNEIADHQQDVRVGRDMELYLHNAQFEGRIVRNATI
jgi:hypothetical protein